MTIQVAVCGPHDCDDELRRLAGETGRLLAARGAVVICGGYGGVMAAAAHGAAAAGGTVVGILSGADRADANPHLSIVIPTGLGQARNAVIVNAGDAVIAVGGSWGTLSEVALAMRTGRVPVVQLGGWHISDPAGRPPPGVRHARTPHEALDLTGLW
ncbi:MAG TPA: TIGR00725 family protein [Streptosporangiaceae bacterium]